MAAETTILLVTEKLRALLDDANPSLKNQVKGFIRKLEYFKKSIEDSPLSIDNEKIQRLQAVNDAEDTIDTYLARAELQKWKVFPCVQPNSENRQASLRQIMKKIGTHMSKLENVRDPSTGDLQDNQAQPADETAEGNAEANTGVLPMGSSSYDSKDRQVLQSEKENYVDDASKSNLSEKLPDQPQEDIQASSSAQTNDHADKSPDRIVGMQHMTTKSEAEISRPSDETVNGNDAADISGVEPTKSSSYDSKGKQVLGDKGVLQNVSPSYDPYDTRVPQLQDVRVLRNESSSFDSNDTRVPAPEDPRVLQNKSPSFDSNDMRVQRSESDSSEKFLDQPQQKRQDFSHEASSSTQRMRSFRTRENLDAEADIVGMKDQIQELQGLTCDEYHFRFLITVEGKAGSGKTTVVKAVYNHSKTRKVFNTRAWVSVSKVFEERSFLVQILKQVTKVTDEEKLPPEELKEKLRNFLTGKRYLIVLDDVQEFYIWDTLKLAFPKSKKIYSRVIVTIRDSKVADKIGPAIFRIHIRPLTDEESWELFLKKVTRDRDRRVIESKQELMDLKKPILQKCGGLPLSITVLGGLLFTKGLSYDAWSKVIGPLKQKKKEERVLELTNTKQEKQQKIIPTKQKNKEELRVVERKEQEIQEPIEPTQQKEKEEQRVFEHIKQEQEIQEVIEPSTQKEEEEEQRDVEVTKQGKQGATRVSEQTKQGETEKELVSEITQQEEIKEEKTSDPHVEQTKQDEDIVPVNASSGSEQGEDQSFSPDQSGILAMVYKDLPSPLRACLQYSCLFPHKNENPIRIRRLVQLWISEGLVIPLRPQSKNEEKKPPEDLVEEYLQELEQRNLIQVTSWYSDERPKRCFVQNSLRELLLENARAMGIVHTHDGTPKSPGPNIRRLAECVDIQNNPPSDGYTKQLYSYISFNSGKEDIPANAVGNFLKKTITKRGFGLLRLLDLEDVYKPFLPDILGKLLLLKYVGLRRTFLDSIPASVGDIPCLETLDVKHTNITTLPTSIWKAKKLRYLYMDGVQFDMPADRPLHSDHLSNLHTLWGLSIGNIKSPTIGLLEGFSLGLRKLGLTCHEGSIEPITKWLEKLTNLQSLRLRSVDEDNQPSSLKLVSIINNHKNLTDLYLLGKLEVTNIREVIPSNLTVLTLSVSELQKDPMEELEKLEHLKILRLFASSFLGEEMKCRRGGFPELQILKLWMLPELSQWIIEEGAMPVLEELEIRNCRKLQKPELEEVTTLKKLTLTNMNEDFVGKVVKSVGKDIVQHRDLEFNPSWD